MKTNQQLVIFSADLLEKPYKCNYTNAVFNSGAFTLGPKNIIVNKMLNIYIDTFTFII